MRSLPAEAGTQVEGQPPAEDNSVLDALSALMYDVPPAGTSILTSNFNI
jgi:hypothetical protein